MSYKVFNPEEIVGDGCNGYGPGCKDCIMEEVCEEEEREIYDQLEEDMTAENGEPTLVKIETVYKSNSRQIVATLRHIAEQIENKEFGEIESASLVIRRKAEMDSAVIGSIEVFGMGIGGYDATVAILSQGLNQMLNMTPYEECEE